MTGERSVGGRRIFVRRLLVLVALIGLCVPVALAVRSDGDTTRVTAAATSTTAAPATVAPTTAVPTSTTTTLPLVAVDDGKTSDERRLVSQMVVKDEDLKPKSIVASGTGLLFAQNMMWRHNVMVFDRSGNVVARIDDTVDLAAFGVEGGVVAQGSPVEAAFTPDGSTVYVSNYKMFGPGYNPIADDDCNAGDWDESFVYEIDTATFTITDVIPVGAVPKFLAVTPDGSKLVVSNWCGFSVSIIDTATNEEITRLDVGRHPRGIAISADSRTAYVAIMGESAIRTIDLRSNSLAGEVPNAGWTPRHLLLSPDGRYLYVSNNHENSVRKIDLQTGAVLGRASTGTETRSMALAEDGRSLFVVNYEDGTVSKVRTDDMEILQTEYTGTYPVGLSYDPVTRQLWVSNYTGALHVWLDQ